MMTAPAINKDRADVDRVRREGQAMTTTANGRGADLRQYILSLKDSPPESAHIELDRDKECAYMASHEYHFRRVLQAIPTDNPNMRVLEIGPTPFTFFLKERFSDFDLFALDRTDLLAERCKSHNIELRTCDLDNESPPFDDESFDLVIFTEVLEHVFAPPTDVLRGIYRILRDDGKLVFSVPNIAALHKRIKLLVGKTPLPHPDAQMNKDWVHGHGHLHEYTMSEVVSILEGSGFRIAKKEYVRARLWDALNMPDRSLKSRLTTGAYRAAQALWPAFGAEIIAEAYK